jgi:hypothetical protein
MARISTNVPFEKWVRHIFDHAVTDPAWYWDVDADSVELDPNRLVSYTTQLFSRSTETLSPFTDAQVDQGLWLFVGATAELHVLLDTTLPLDDRVCCIDSIATLFKDCFAQRCTAHLSHIDEPGAGPMNSICYMWWDIFPFTGHPEDASQKQIDDACLAVMQKTLEIHSMACQESALHGLGHWVPSYGDRCRKIIASFVQKHPELRSELRDYAMKASRANVL